MTCSGCDNTWGGYTRCHCSACHRTFSGLTYFDAHRKWGKCVDPAKVKKKGQPLMRLEGGLWRAFEDDDRRSNSKKVRK